jgi:hypothetical protein
MKLLPTLLQQLVCPTIAIITVWLNGLSGKTIVIHFCSCVCEQNRLPLHLSNFLLKWVFNSNRESVEP